MSTSLLTELASRVRGQVRLDEPLADYTTYRIGGPAAALVLPLNTADVVEVLRFCNDTGTRWLALGLGSNVLIADRGFDGVVVRLGKGMDAVQTDVDDSMVWRVGAGLPTPLLARRTARAGFAGVQRLIGVPGTVGGGIAMNAGAHGQDFSQVARSVEFVEPDGTVREVCGSQIAWRYRESGLERTIVTAATLAFRPGDSAELLRDFGRYLRWRKRGTPFDEPCCGSVFRNPVTAQENSGRGGATGASRTAGRLIDALGLKGLRVGGAQVSSRHANYIVNLGHATAEDVRRTIEMVRSKVLEEFGVELKLEVGIVA